MRRLLVLALVLAACAKKPPPRDVNAAMQKCQGALARISAMPDDGRDFFPTFAEGCADLHADEACRAAWMAAAKAAPAQRTMLLVRGCVPAACPTLPEPRPMLCRTDAATLSPEALENGWIELYGALLHRDLPMPQGEKLASILVELHRPPPAPAVVALQIRPQREGGWLVQVDHDRAKEVSAPLTDEDVAAIAKRMSEVAPPASSAAIVRVEEGLPKSQLEPIVNALKAKGFRDVALEIVPAPH